MQFTASLFVAPLVKNPPAMRETWVPSLGWEDPLEKGTATRSSMLGELHGLSSPWGRKESDATERAPFTLHFSESSAVSPLRKACTTAPGKIKASRSRDNSTNVNWMYIVCPVTLCVCAHVQLRLTLCNPMDCSPAVVCHFLHQGIFPTHGSNRHLLCLLH